MMMEAAVAVDAGSRRRRSWSGGRPAAGAVVKSEGGRRDMMLMDGFSISSASATPVFWNSRRRPSVHLPRSRKVTDDDGNKSPTANPATATAADDESDGKNGSGSDAPVNNASSVATSSVEDAQASAEAEKNLLELSERRKALFEPLDPADGPNGRRFLAEELLPPPDFDSVSYPKGWLVGKKRKLVNVDVVESMRRIAVLEMNRKDREIDGLNEQLQEDAQCLERLQVQLLEERSRRADVERENAMLKSQVALLMDMLQEAEEAAGRDGMEEEVIVEEEDNGGNNRSL